MKRLDFSHKGRDYALVRDDDDWKGAGTSELVDCETNAVIAEVGSYLGPGLDAGGLFINTRRGRWGYLDPLESGMWVLEQKPNVTRIPLTTNHAAALIMAACVVIDDLSSNC